MSDGRYYNSRRPFNCCGISIRSSRFVLLLMLLVPASADYSSWYVDSLVSEGIEALTSSGLPQDWWSSSSPSPQSQTQQRHRLKNKVRDKIDLEREPLPFDPEAYMTSPEIITNRGYPLEIHHITTDDGYILELHRIPPRGPRPPSLHYSKTGQRVSSRNETNDYWHRRHSYRSQGPGRARPIYLQHGVMSSSACWLINPSDSSLAFRLADAGYDVWLGNSRGNIYSRRHAWLETDDPQFWQYTWDELGGYDIPASLRFILSKTGFKKLSYIGHSLGTGIFFIAMIRHPELNEHIHKMIALAPITSKFNLRSPFRFVAPIIQPLANIFDRFERRAIFDSDDMLRRFQTHFCETTFHKASFCRDLLFTIAGANPDNFDLRLLPTVNAHLLQGTSVRVIAQFAQSYNSGRETFQYYDYGRSENLQRYGQEEPWLYDLSRVTAPVYLYYGNNDLISTPEDSQWAAAHLGNVRGFYRVADDKFQHWDFLWSINVNPLLYDHIIPMFR